MGFRDGLLRWTIPAGRWGGTAVRISALLPLAGIAATVQTGSPAVGAAVAGTLLAVSAATEIVRIALCARLGQPVEECLIWPLGGLEPIERTPTRSPWVHLAVPATGLALCGVLWGSLRAARTAITFDPALSPAAAALISAAVVTAANLLPTWPLACGRAVRDLWAERSGPHLADAAAAALTHLIGVLWLFFALCFGSAWVAVSAACVMFATRDRRPRSRPATAPKEDDTFLGYDFSAGYTSLERDLEDDESDSDRLEEDADLQPADESPMSAWRRQREQARQERERRQRLDDERQVDRLLRKISAEGEGALTTEERHVLNRVAARLREGAAGD